MFSISRQTHPATGIEHAVSCCFFNNDETCLVTAGVNIMKVFRLLPEGHSKEVNAGKSYILCLGVAFGNLLLEFDAGVVGK